MTLTLYRVLARSLPEAKTVLSTAISLLEGGIIEDAALDHQPDPNRVLVMRGDCHVELAISEITTETQVANIHGYFYAVAITVSAFEPGDVALAWETLVALNEYAPSAIWVTEGAYAWNVLLPLIPLREVVFPTGERGHLMTSKELADFVDERS